MGGVNGYLARAEFQGIPHHIAQRGSRRDETDEPEKLNVLRRNINKGLPCDSEVFIDRLSIIYGHSLKFLPRGRPRKKEDEEKG